jgi:hypothetical protein
MLIEARTLGPHHTSTLRTVSRLGSLHKLQLRRERQGLYRCSLRREVMVLRVKVCNGHTGMRRSAGHVSGRGRKTRGFQRPGSQVSAPRKSSQNMKNITEERQTSQNYSMSSDDSANKSSISIEPSEIPCGHQFTLAKEIQ